MAYDINAALERLENNLAEVESAKKQVEETIATSESLQQIIGRYTDTLNAMGKDISSFIEEIRNYQDINTSELSSATDAIKTSCECVINKFNADVKDAMKSFDEKLSETIVKFGSENEKLRIQVNKLNSLQDVLNKATKEVKNHASDLKTKSEEIIEDVSKAIQKLDNQNSVLTETKNLCDDIKGDIGNLKDSIDAQFESMRSIININRWIAIIGILALIVLHFI